jgi:hypothetical protein
MLYAFFWVIPRVLNFYADVSEHSAVSSVPTYEDGTVTVFRNPGNYPEESTKRLRIVKCSRRTETLQRRVFGRPADSAFSQVGIFVLIMKETLLRNRKNVKDVNMVHVQVKVKVKITLEQATNAQSGSRSIVVLFL